MFTLYQNEYPLRICTPEEAEVLLPPANDRHLRMRYAGHPRSFFPYLDAFEKGTSKIYSVAFLSPDPEAAIRDLLGLFVIVEAAGGLVFDPEDRILAMYRRGWWDLPKGKIDPGETPEQAALREVVEETAAPQLELGLFLAHTYHVFRLKDKRRAVKLTHWFRMRSPGGPLVPQTEEGIEQLAWLSKDELLDKDPLFRNIEDLLGKI
jgi:8-oxo-dGTP pyrophosphatase MutT (NUDIX family)